MSWGMKYVDELEAADHQAVNISINRSIIFPIIYEWLALKILVHYSKTVSVFANA